MFFIIYKKRNIYKEKLRVYVFTYEGCIFLIEKLEKFKEFREIQFFYHFCFKLRFKFQN